MSALPFALAFGGYFAFIIVTGLRLERRGEKPFRNDPRYWVTGDPEETERRYRDALRQWRQRA